MRIRRRTRIKRRRKTRSACFLPFSVPVSIDTVVVPRFTYPRVVAVALKEKENKNEEKEDKEDTEHTILTFLYFSPA